jgi:hypothetical protein
MRPVNPLLLVTPMYISLPHNLPRGLAAINARNRRFTSSSPFDRPKAFPRAPDHSIFLGPSRLFLHLLSIELSSKGLFLAGWEQSLRPWMGYYCYIVMCHRRKESRICLNRCSQSPIRSLEFFRAAMEAGHFSKSAATATSDSNALQPLPALCFSPVVDFCCGWKVDYWCALLRPSDGQPLNLLSD